MKRKCLVTLLLLALLCSSCNTGNDTTVSPDTNTNTDTVTEVTDTAPRDGLSAELDYNGADVKFHAGLWMNITKDPLAAYYAEELSGDVLNDAMYNRNHTVDERLNVKLSFNWHETTWNSRTEELSYYTSAIMAGDDAFDIVSYIAHLLPSVCTDGSMYDLRSLEYMDLSKPWWTQFYNQAATVNGKLYFATGDIALGVYQNTYCMYFNQALVDDLSLEDPYTLVENGNWTLDTLQSLSAQSYADLNGDGKRDVEDQWGLLIEGGNCISGFMEACDVTIFDISADGKSVDYVFGSEHNINVIQEMCALLHESDGVYYRNNTTDLTADQYVFYNGNVVFTGGWFGDTDYYRELEFDYGVLPYPKYDENQTDYYTRVGTACPIVAVPVTTKDPSMVSAVLEVMAAEGYYQLRPAYFDTALKNKYSRDEKTKDMIDLIVDNITVDFGTIYVYVLDSISDQFKNTIAANNANWASQTAKWQTSVMTKLDALLESFQK